MRGRYKLQLASENGGSTGHRLNPHLHPCPPRPLPPHPSPRYQDYQKGDIPVVELPGAPGSSVRVMAGTSSTGGVTGPIRMRNPGLLMDVRLGAGGSFKQEVPEVGVDRVWEACKGLGAVSNRGAQSRSRNGERGKGRGRGRTEFAPLGLRL